MAEYMASTDAPAESGLERVQETAAAATRPTTRARGQVHRGGERRADRRQPALALAGVEVVDFL